MVTSHLENTAPFWPLNYKKDIKLVKKGQRRATKKKEKKKKSLKIKFYEEFKRHNLFPL